MYKMLPFIIACLTHTDSHEAATEEIFSFPQIGSPPKPLGQVLVEWRLVGQVAQVGYDS